MAFARPPPRPRSMRRCEVNRRVRNGLLRRLAPTSDFFHRLPVPVTCIKIHIEVHACRIALQYLIHRTMAFEDFTPIEQG